MDDSHILIVGAGGQLGKALQKVFPGAEFADRSSFDITDPSTWGDRDWRQYQTIINAAAFTKVDAAESSEGRIDAWRTNASAVGNLAQLSIQNDLCIVHISTDYVFDGTLETHPEDEPASPLGVYGQTKAAGDVAAAVNPHHYLLRCSWVIGDGGNFVRAIVNRVKAGENPGVVNDQFGRLTFTDDLAQAIKHLINTNAPFGTYNMSNDGDVSTWQDVAREIYSISGQDPDRVSGVTAEEYFRDKFPVSPRPTHSTLDLEKIKATGFSPRDWKEALKEYVESLD